MACTLVTTITDNTKERADFLLNLLKTHFEKTHTHTQTHTHTHPYLLNIPVEAEEVEDAGTVHLGWMEATHHGNRAGCMSRV